MMVSGLPIQEITEHKEQFKTWPVSLPQFHKKEVYVGPTGQMDKSTTMADAFVKHQMQPLVLAKAQPPAKRSTAPLEVGSG